MTMGEYQELKRIADALEKIATALTTPTATVHRTNFGAYAGEWRGGMPKESKIGG